MSRDDVPTDVRPIPDGATECPDCHASLKPWLYAPHLNCEYRLVPGYGSCGVFREPPTLVEAAAALGGYSDRDHRNVIIPLYKPDGRRRREWHDFRDALARAAASPGQDEGERPE